MSRAIGRGETSRGRPRPHPACRGNYCDNPVTKMRLIGTLCCLSSPPCAQNGFRANAKRHFVNHHEAHGLGALFSTDWDDALIYTANGIGDKLSHSARCCGKECSNAISAEKNGSWSEGRRPVAWLPPMAAPLRSPDFRKWQHEGKLTGLLARRHPTPRMSSLVIFL
jgi:predicted NodU family carbamoyl transferase